MYRNAKVIFGMDLDSEGKVKWNSLMVWPFKSKINREVFENEAGR